MNNNYKWQVSLGVVLIALTSAVYYVHFLIFRDAHHIFLYFIGDVAFVFFEVLLVTLVIHRLLHHRKQKAVLDKVHMLTGAFFSEMGTELLRQLAKFDEQLQKISQDLLTPHDWSEVEFLDIRKTVQKHNPAIDSKTFDLDALNKYLCRHKAFLLDLIQNPSLLQNEPFSNLVWAIFHLTKELEHRGDLKNLTDPDRRHLAEDIKRVYQELSVQWMDYMQHLKAEYPYLFSLAGRTNPFNRLASVDVK